MSLLNNVRDKETTVAYLGPPTSYSHQAALKSFPKNARFAPQSIISDVFEEVQARRVDVGVAPVENSSNGPVDFTLDCLADPYQEYSSIFVSDETYLEINHCLVGRAQHTIRERTSIGRDEQDHLDKDDSKSASAYLGTNLDGITDVYSHPQALGQCRKFLAAHLKLARLHETSSTSEAASIVAKLGTSSAAAISSQMAGENLGLEVLAAQIQDGKDNVTRFLIVANDATKEAIGPSEGESLKMLVSFRVDHKAPGALADALSVFKSHEVNLVSINSRPSRDKPWHYVFLAELVAVGGSEDASMALKKAIDELRSKTEQLRQLGSWWLKGSA